MTVVDPSLKAAPPPDTLYYGTSATLATTALIEGLLPGAQSHVRLFANPASARKASDGNGKQVVFTVYARAAYDEGQPFWVMENGVWLTTAVERDCLYLPPVRGAE